MKEKNNVLIVNYYYFQVSISPFNFSKTFSTDVPDTTTIFCLLLDPYKK